MKTKKRNGLPLREWLTGEMKDPVFRRHYEDARAQWQAGRAVVEARRAAGITQAELARRIGSDQKGVWRLEAGQQNATVGILEKVAQATGGSLEIRIRRPARATAARR